MTTLIHSSLFALFSLQNLTLISQHFNIFKWWEDVGRRLFPRIYVIACCILMLPDSNGHLERCFSSATWMDGKLNKRQSQATFEMKNLLYRNQAFMVSCKIMLTGKFQEMAKKTTEALIEEIQNMREERRVIDKEEVECVDSDNEGEEDEDLDLSIILKRNCKL